jgi:acyl-CoA thioesterase
LPVRISQIARSPADKNIRVVGKGPSSDFVIRPPTAGRGASRLPVWFHPILRHADRSPQDIGHVQRPLSDLVFKEISVSDAAAVSSRELALQCADFLWSHDAALRGLGLERLSIKPGHAVVAMTVLPAMVNGFGITHGAAIFAFADAAFSLAANSYNERTVAAHCCISFLEPTRLGDRLVAAATEVVRSARSGIYDISVTMEKALVAEFRAHSRVIGGTVLPATTFAPNCAVAESVNQ